MTTTAIYAILPNLRKDLPYDPVRDFVPIGRIATASNVLVVNNALPAQNVAELVSYAKERPGALNYASAGIGTPAHLAGEMLNLLADIKVAHIPYKGAAPGLLDVIAGNAQYIITSPIAAGAHMGAGRVRAIASTGTERNPALPDVPTVADTLPGYEITQSWGVVAPAGTPPDVVKRLGGRVRQGARERRRQGQDPEDRRGPREQRFARGVRRFHGEGARAPGRRHHALEDRAQGIEPGSELRL